MMTSAVPAAQEAAGGGAASGAAAVAVVSRATEGDLLTEAVTVTGAAAAAAPAAIAATSNGLQGLTYEQLEARLLGFLEPGEQLKPYTSSHFRPFSSKEAGKTHLCLLCPADKKKQARVNLASDFRLVADLVKGSVDAKGSVDLWLSVLGVLPRTGRALPTPSG